MPQYCSRTTTHGRNMATSLHKFSGTAPIFESQEAMVEAILNDGIKAGEVVVSRYDRN